MSTSDEMYDAAVKLKDLGDLAGAVLKLQEVIAADPGHAVSHSALAVYLQKLGRLDEAIHHARQVVELEPHDSFSYTQLSVICQRCGKIPEAEEALARAKILSGQRH